MAPRQRNMSTPSTPNTSEDESCADDASLLLEQKSGSNTKSMMAKATFPKTLNITESDIARDNHDYFNIVALAVVVFACALNYEYPSLSYTGDYFWTMWAVSSKLRNTTSKLPNFTTIFQQDAAVATFTRDEPHLFLIQSIL